jgi:hypothetical protein
MKSDVDEARRALRALALEVPPAVHDDVVAKIAPLLDEVVKLRQWNDNQAQLLKDLSKAAVEFWAFWKALDETST